MESQPKVLLDSTQRPVDLLEQLASGDGYTRIPPHRKHPRLTGLLLPSMSLHATSTMASISLMTSSTITQMSSTGFHIAHQMLNDAHFAVAEPNDLLDSFPIITLGFSKLSLINTWELLHYCFWQLLTLWLTAIAAAALKINSSEIIVLRELYLATGFLFFWFPER